MSFLNVAAAKQVSLLLDIFWGLLGMIMSSKASWEAPSVYAGVLHTYAPRPAAIRHRPCHCRVTTSGCSYQQERGTPFCADCQPSRWSNGRCSCPCRACDPSDTDWSSSDHVSTKSISFRKVKHMCFQKKFEQRQRKRRHAERWNRHFDDCLEHHFVACQTDTFHDVEQSTPASRTHHLQKNLRLHNRRQNMKQSDRIHRWLSLAVLLWFSFDVKRGVEQDEAPTCHKADEICLRRISERGSPITKAVGATDEMKWLKWQKTRDDIFGHGQEPWCESWALFPNSEIP